MRAITTGRTHCDGGAATRPLAPARGNATRTKHNNNAIQTTKQRYTPNQEQATQQPIQQQNNSCTNNDSNNNNNNTQQQYQNNDNVYSTSCHSNDNTRTTAHATFHFSTPSEQ